MRRFSFLFSLLFLFACKKDVATLELKPVSGSSIVARTAPSYIAYLFNNNVYVVKSDGSGAKQLTNNYTALSECVISPDNKKVAYLDTALVPVIIDLQGNVLKRLADKPYSQSLGWSWNNETLYFLFNNKLVFEGPALPVTHTDLSYNFPTPVLQFVSISPKNDVAFSYYTSIFSDDGRLCLYRKGGDSLFFDGSYRSYMELKFTSSGDSLLYYSGKTYGNYFYRVKTGEVGFVADGLGHGLALKHDRTEILHTTQHSDSTFLEIIQPKGYKDQDLHFNVAGFQGQQNIIFDWK